jgi:hypothetical protein
VGRFNFCLQILDFGYMQGILFECCIIFSLQLFFGVSNSLPKNPKCECE